MIDKYLLNEYINNASDIYNLTLSDNFKSLIDFNFKEKIYIKSTLIYRKDYISYIFLPPQSKKLLFLLFAFLFRSI